MSAFSLSPLLAAQCHFVGHSRSSVSYCRDHSLDWSTINSVAGLLRLADIVIEPGRRFDFAGPGDENAVEAAVIEAYAEDGETALDLIAWPVSDPSRFVTMFEAVPLLGEAAAHNPSTYFNNSPLRLFRRPLEWLQAGGNGAVILHPERAARRLLDIPTSWFAADDDAHARTIEAARHKLFDSQRILVPEMA